MADYKLIGKNYTTPDILAKVTGRAKYAEDFRAEGMLFTKLLVSPMPHARVRRLDTSAAMAMPGVEAILTADDLPEAEAPQEAGLTNEPLYEGEPILAIAAVDEETAAEAVEAVQIDFEPLPFVLDPMDSLRPGGPNARLDGNTMAGRDLSTIKWGDVDWSEFDRGVMPLGGEVTDEWQVGDVDAGFAEADLILDESVFSASLSHQPLETRTAMAYWQNGKCYMHCSTQSTARTEAGMARWIGIDPTDLVLITEYCGGGFGSKISSSVQARIPALLSRKAGRPVMMRVTRQEENFFGRARPGIQARAKFGFRSDGRVVAIDLTMVQDGGPYGRSGDYMSCADQASLMYQPEHMRVRGMTVYTNTPPRGAQRAPGGVQAVAMFAPIVDKAARQLDLDRLDIIHTNAPQGQAIFGRPRQGRQGNVSSAFPKEAIDKAREEFDWEGMKARSGQRNGSKVTGVGVAISSYSAGTSGVDGLLVIRPDGMVEIHTGVGNLGTESFSDTSRAAMEALDTPWEQAEVVWGDTSKHLPWSAIQGGSQTTHGHTRSNWAAGLEAKKRLQEIAADRFGGSPDSFDVGEGRVFRRGNRGQAMTFGQAAERAIQLGGVYDGSQLPEDINEMTTRSATALAGRGLVVAAKDNFETGGRNMSFCIGFAEVEVDTETGAVVLKDYKVASDAGTVLHPQNFAGQVHGGGIQGFGVALGQKWVMDPQWGLHVAKRFYSNRPPTILDAPHDQEMAWSVADEPDPFNPLGAKGIGEAPVGAGAGAVLNAISDALGGNVDFNRSPIMGDMILTMLNPELDEAHNKLSTHV
ncbi:MAG: xanthine dehydrogenase family protein molybdopterin-binding subunit [Acidobacteria bacterium]|nr:xanthine dehydrogenase family protein molybdopterin-binding subunit [Acidobacteriota bacterium]